MLLQLSSTAPVGAMEAHDRRTGTRMHSNTRELHCTRAVCGLTAKSTNGYTLLNFSWPCWVLRCCYRLDKTLGVGDCAEHAALPACHHGCVRVLQEEHSADAGGRWRMLLVADVADVEGLSQQDPLTSQRLPDRSRSPLTQA